jgi:hypothetical protein
MRTITSPRRALNVPYPRRTARTPAGRLATAGRLALGVYFLLMAAVNILITLPNANATYDGLARLSWPHFGWIPELISGLAVPFTILLVAWEIAVGVLLLSCGRAVRVALWAALFQVLALAPFLGWYEVVNLATAVLVAVLLTRTHDRTVIDVMRRREHHSSEDCDRAQESSNAQHVSR